MKMMKNLAEAIRLIKRLRAMKIFKNNSSERREIGKIALGRLGRNDYIRNSTKLKNKRIKSNYFSSTYFTTQKIYQATKNEFSQKVKKVLNTGGKSWRSGDILNREANLVQAFKSTEMNRQVQRSYKNLNQIFGLNDKGTELVDSSSRNLPPINMGGNWHSSQYKNHFHNGTASSFSKEKKEQSFHIHNLQISVENLSSVQSLIDEITRTVKKNGF